jgi:hypothetical protein
MVDNATSINREWQRSRGKNRVRGSDGKLPNDFLAKAETHGTVQNQAADRIAAFDANF